MPPSAHGPLVVSIIASVLGALVMCLLVARYGLTPPADESPDAAERRLMVTRFGHAFAGVCFAATGILGLVALVAPARQAPPAPRPVAVQPDPAAEARLQALAAEIRAIAPRLEQVETRVGAVDSAARRLGDEIASVNLRVRQMERAMVPPPRRAAVLEAPAKEAREPDVPTSTLPPTRATPEPAAATRTPPPSVRPPEPAAAPRTISLPPPASEPRSLPTASRASDYASAPPSRVEAPPRHPDGSAAAAKPDEALGDKLREDWKAIRNGFETAGDDLKAAIRDLGRKLWR